MNPMHGMTSLFEGLQVAVCLRAQQVVESERPTRNRKGYQFVVEYLERTSGARASFVELSGGVQIPRSDCSGYDPTCRVA